jgi:hypothetical protein
MVTPDICSCIVVALTGEGRCHVEAPTDNDISKVLDYFEDATVSGFTSNIGEESVIFVYNRLNFYDMIIHILTTAFSLFHLQ